MSSETKSDDLYEFEEKSNRKARNRTLMILGAGAALGVGAVAATAMGFAGPNQEVSILENHEGFGPGFGDDHEEREGHEPDFSEGVTE